MKSKNNGFSLIELMIVIAIIGILAAIAIPSYQIYVKKTKVGEVIQLLSSYQVEIATYYNETGKFPLDLSIAPNKTLTSSPVFPSNIVDYIYWDNAEPSPNNFPKCYLTAQLTSEFGGGQISIVGVIADPDAGISFSCGIWNMDPFYTGNGETIKYFPSSCQQFNQEIL